MSILIKCNGIWRRWNQTFSAVGPASSDNYVIKSETLASLITPRQSPRGEALDKAAQTCEYYTANDD